MYTFNFEMKDVGPETNQILKRLFPGERGGFIHVGPKKYILTKRYEEMAADIYNMEIRPNDVFVVTYPRSGTTWTQELVYLVNNDFKYETAKAPITERFPYLENAILIHPTLKQELLETIKDEEQKRSLEFLAEPILDYLAAAPSPRLIKSHLPLSLLPPNLLDAKVVYVARDPRDVAVSLYHLCSTAKPMEYVGDFKTFWNLFINDLVYWTPFFDHIKESWEKRHHQNMLFLFYEELRKDLAKAVRVVAEFLNKTCTDEQVSNLCDHLGFNNFKNNSSVNSDPLKEMGLVVANHEFIRKGKTGGWRDYFDEEMTAQAQKWIDDNLKDTDLRFPHLQ